MRTRHILYAAACVVITLVAACSNIDEDERLIYVKPAEVAKHVLIEDFTGQACVNCPAATSIISGLQEQYGEENVIAVGIYSGYFGATVSGRLYPLTTELGNYYYNQNAVSEQPTAMIDRHSLNSNTATWAAEVYNYIQETSPLELSITSTYDETAQTTDIEIDAFASEDVSGKLQVWLTEDNIVNWQYLSDGSVDDNYVHNHVLRATVSDRDGEAIAMGEGNSERFTFSAALDEDWVAGNVSVVAFVFNDSGVLQAAKSPVVGLETETAE